VRLAPVAAALLAGCGSERQSSPAGRTDTVVRTIAADEAARAGKPPCLRRPRQPVEVTGREGYISFGYRARRLSTLAGLRAALLTLYEDGVVRKLVERWRLDGVTLLPLP
jgi:hypothetical protein